MSQTQGLIAVPQDNRHIHLYDINGVRYGRPTKMSKVTRIGDSFFTGVIVDDNNVRISVCCKVVTSAAAFYPTAGDEVMLPLVLSNIKWRWWVYMIAACRCIQSGVALHQGPRVGPGHPSSPIVHLLPHLFPFYFSLSFIGYFLLLSIPSLSTRIVPLLFQAGGRRRRPNLGLFFVV